jgi:AcrR family transcriptional regulator
VALEVSSTSEPLRQACAEVFESWLTSATEYFAGAGIDRDQAHRLALQMLSLLEGAFIFSRAMRTTEPVQVAGEAAVAAVRAALSHAG